jgi:Amt family ammonium transporter
LSLAAWAIIKAIFGLRVDEEAEMTGLDISEMGMEAYPEDSVVPIR